MSNTASVKKLVHCEEYIPVVPGGFLSKKNLDSKLDYLRVKNDSHKAASLAISRRVTGKSGNFSTLFKEIQKYHSFFDSICYFFSAFFI